jgi:hypothetical protein
MLLSLDLGQSADRDSQSQQFEQGHLDGGEILVSLRVSTVETNHIQN